jgi:hypothetical protein
MGGVDLQTTTISVEKKLVITYSRKLQCLGRDMH